MSNLVKAIHKLKPNSEFRFENDDYSTIEWIVIDGDAPTQKEIDAALKQVVKDEKAEIEQREIQRQAILDRIGLTADELKTILG
jgi:hypothetical protein